MRGLPAQKRRSGAEVRPHRTMGTGNKIHGINDIDRINDINKETTA